MRNSKQIWTEHWQNHFMYLCKNLRWKSFLIVSLIKRFGALVSPRAWFLKTTSSSHLEHRIKSQCFWESFFIIMKMQRNCVNLLLTLKEAELLILINGFPRINSASFALSSSSCCCCSCHIGRKCTNKVREEIEEMGDNDINNLWFSFTIYLQKLQYKNGCGKQRFGNINNYNQKIFLRSMFIFQEILIFKKLF